MGTGAQVVVVAVAILVVLARLAVALCQARTDGRIAARRAREDRPGSRRALGSATARR
jgi:hypothetical protein